MRTVCLALSLVLLGGCAVAQNLEIEYLPELPGTTFSRAEAINNRGQIVGSCYINGQYHAVLWEHEQVFELPLLEGFVENIAYDINNAGVVVGILSRPSPIAPEPLAFTWTKNEGYTLIYPPPGDQLTSAFYIDNAGKVYGTTSEAGDFGHRSDTTKWFSWTAKGGMLITETRSSVNDTNTRGEMVGSRYIPGEGMSAAIWRRGREQ